jgi:hypothetical protein
MYKVLGILTPPFGALTRKEAVAATGTPGAGVGKELADGAEY